MKKLVALVLSLLLSVSVCAFADGYPAGWYSLSGNDGLELSLFYLPDGSTVSVPDGFTLSPLEDAVSFTAAPGMYVVGVDFPAGTYSVRCADGESLFNIKVKDEKGSSVFNDGFWADKGEYLGKIELLDGYSVSIDQGKAYFSAPGGIVFDSASASASASVSDDESSNRLVIPKSGTSLIDAANSAVEQFKSDEDD